MARSAILAIRIISDATQAAKAMQTVESRADRMERRLGKASRVAGLGLAALGTAAISAGKDLARIETINAQTEAAIASTGGAAGVTASEVEALSGRLEKLTATEAETTQENANLLLTFTNVKNGVGAANQVFDRAVTTFVDMQRANPSASMQMLGKALNDPIRGIASLTRVGVQFSDQQRQQIASMVEAGDTMGAQKVILKELETQFGGSGAAFAATAAGQAQLAAHAYGELAESLTVALLPAFSSAVAIGLQVVEFLSANQTTTQAVIIAVAALAAAVIAVNSALKVYRATLVAVAAAKKALRLVTLAQTAAQYALGTAWLAGRVASLALAAGMRVLNAAMRANPLGLIITAITVVAGLFVTAYRRSETFRNIVKGVGKVAAAQFRVITTPIRAVINAIKSLINWISNIRWPSPPASFSKVAGFFGLGGPPRAVLAATAGTRTGTATAASAATGRGGPNGRTLMLPAGRAGSAGGNVIINISGALDPVGVADQLSRMLRRRGYRLGTSVGR